MKLIAGLTVLLHCASSLGAAVLQKRAFTLVQPIPHRILARTPDGGPIAYMRSLNKFNLPVPPGLKKRHIQLQKRQAAQPTENVIPDETLSEYQSPILLGSNRQLITTAIDTGSSDLWVFSADLPAQALEGHLPFREKGPNGSTTFKRINNASWSISYGDGTSASGFVGTDTIEIAGIKFPDQGIEVATSASRDFLNNKNFNGIMGLAFSKLNTVKNSPQRTFFDNIRTQLREPLFSVDLGFNASGTYEFGFVNENRFTGQLQRVPIDSSSGFWQVDSKKFGVGDQVTNLPNAAPAIVDTGSSLVIVDNRVADLYYKSVPNARLDRAMGGYVYPCQTKLPDAVLAVGDYMARIPGNRITFARTDRQGQNCFGGIQPNNGGNVQIFGDVMFQHHFVVFESPSGNNPASIRLAPKRT